MLSLGLAWLCLQRVFISDALLPAHQSAIPWTLETVTDVEQGGSSTLSVKDSVYSIDYDYFLTEDRMFPYVIVVLAFADLNTAEKLADLSGYSSARFRVKCTPDNVLTLHLHSYDEKVTDPGTFSTYRIAGKLFSCNSEWSQVEIDLNHLQVPVWWLETHQQNVSDNKYWLDKAVAISFDNARQGPLNTPAKVTVSEITLEGKDWRYAWLLAGLLVIVWAGFITWLVKQYTLCLIVDLKDKLKKDRPLIAYQQLSIEPHKDEIKSRVLRFMATEYANEEMSLEFATTTLGINRTKINEILKDELGLTFSTYLNKLRLSEAARLLSEQEEANVAEIAYLVGYNNVTYFNKLFKNEYGCTPKIFKGLY